MIKKDTALVLIDIQNDYFEGGLNPLYNVESALINSKKVLEFFREKHLKIIHIQHISNRKNAPFFIKDTVGANIHKDVFPVLDEEVIVKHSPNSFHETKLDVMLKASGIKNLVICGMMSHHCVDSTVRCAKDYGYEVTLIRDACATKNLEMNGEVIEAETVHKVFMAALQGFAQVVEVDFF